MSEFASQLIDRTKLFKTGAAALTLGAVLSQAGCTSEAKNPVPTETFSTETLAPVPSIETNLGARVLREVVACDFLGQDTELNKELVEKRLVVADGRCDGEPDKPIGVYSGSSQGSTALGVVVNGEELKALGYERGDMIQNIDNAASNVWVDIEFKGRKATIPLIWTQGFDPKKVDILHN